MHWLKNLRLTPKLMLAFGVVLVLLAAQGVGAYFGLSSLNRATTTLEGSLQTASTAAEIRALVGEYRTASYRGLVRASEAVKLDARQRTETLSGEIDANLAAYAKLATTAQERKLLEDLSTSWAMARASYESVNEMIDLELPDDALDTFLGETSDLHNVATAAVTALMLEADRQADEAGRDAAGAFTASVSVIVVMLLVGIAGGIAIALLIARSLASSMRVAVTVANDVADGKLDSRIDTSTADEIGDLLRSMQRMQHDLRERTERDQAAAAENLRIRTALGSSSIGLMITDASYHIAYTNPSLVAMLQGHADQIALALPELDLSEPLEGRTLEVLEVGGKVSPEFLARLEREGRATREVNYGQA